MKSLGHVQLCDPMNCSPPGSSVHGIFQARILEWVAISSSRESSWPRDQTQVSRVVGRRFTTWVTREIKIITCSQSFTFFNVFYCFKQRRQWQPSCSCLEYPRDGGAWWAAVYGVAQSRTRLVWLGSSSSSSSSIASVLWQCEEREKMLVFPAGEIKLESPRQKVEQVCVCAHMCVRVYVCVWVCAHMCVHVHVCACMYVYTRMCVKNILCLVAQILCLAVPKFWLYYKACCYFKI